MRKSFFVKYSGLLLPLLFLLGFLSGVACICVFRDYWLTVITSLEPDFLWKIEQIDVDKSALFFLTLGKRLRAFFLLWILSYSLLKNPAATVFFFYSGACVGTVMELLAIKYGIRGLLFYLGMILPQALFYTPGYLLLGLFCLNRIRRNEEGKREKRRKDYRIWMALGSVIIGILLESYVNPELLKMLAGFLLA
ncbi:MAG: stage II sporulation protein M [Lachnospiraceae bacterium]|nr:stage II sporulation protein M [Lachnospiraceae bacterium]MDY5701382.1 stage II sporulation protein M [Lachnospiraceae bacterium]